MVRNSFRTCCGNLSFTYLHNYFSISVRSYYEMYLQSSIENTGIVKGEEKKQSGHDKHC